MKTIVTMMITVLMTVLLVDIYQNALGFGGLQGWIAVLLHGVSYPLVWAAALYVRKGY